MAGMKSIDAASLVLQDRMLELRELVRLVDELADEIAPDGARVPAWVWVVGDRVRAVEEAVEGYLGAVHQHARPVLSDMAKISRA